MHLSSLSQDQRKADKLWSELTFGKSENDRQQFDIYSASAFRLRDEGLERQTGDVREVEFHLGRRIADMSLWIEELDAKSDSIIAQLSDLSVYITRLHNALSSVPPILKVDLEILMLRKRRIGVDLIVDEPQRKLTEEIRIIKDQEKSASNLLGICEENGRLLRKFLFALGKQLEDRKRAKVLDSTALSLNPHSTNLTVSNPSKKANKISYPTENEIVWEKISWNERTKAELLLKQSENLQTRVESALRIFCESLQTAICNTNGALEERLANLKQTKAQLEAEHLQISISIRENEDLIDKLKKAREEKNSSLALTQSRIGLRSQRPNLELVWDEVDKGLAKEEKILKWSMIALDEELIGAKKVMRTLLASQLAIEEQINVKMNSLAIDEIHVIPLRKTIAVYKQ